MTYRNLSIKTFAMCFCFMLLVGPSLITSKKALAQELIFTADHFPPYEYATPTGKALGFDVEVIQAAFDSLGITVRFDFVPWKRAVALVEEGKATGYFSCSYSAKRASFTHVSGPISETTLGAIFRKDYPHSEIKVVKDMKNLQVAAIAGYSGNKRLTDAGVPFETIPHISSGFPMLAEKRFDALFLSLEAGQFLAMEAGLAGKLDFVQLQDIKPKTYHLCFGKKWPNYLELTEKFNTAVEGLRASGKLDAIHDRYR